MTTLFISDLHLSESNSQTTELFFKFMENETRHVAALYILGDFFETWIGDDDNSIHNQKVMNELARHHARGLKIFFMHGNRDFLIGKSFLKSKGCEFLADESKISLASQSTLLMHGDTLCTQDVNYLKFRKVVRNRLIQRLFLLTPLTFRNKIAKKLRASSQSYTQNASENIMDVYQPEVLRIMRQHQVRQLIHGHTHRPAIHQFELDGLPATRIVLGAWHQSGSVLICHDDGKQELTTYL